MSIRKRTWITSKGLRKEAWVVNYTDQLGRRRLKTFVKKKDADAFASVAAVQVREGTHTADSASATISVAGELWIATAEQHALERTTVNSYRQHLKFHIGPYIGHLKLSQLSAPMVRDFEDKLRAGGRSPAMVKKVRGSLSALVSDAQERGLVARNAVRELGSRRRRGKELHAERRQRGKLKVGVDIPSPAEIKAITAAVSERWRPLLLTAIFTGLRASELRGLRWPDLDLKGGELHVRRRADCYQTMGPPKTAAGERSVPIPPGILNVLRKWRLACPKGDLDLVFPNGDGRIEWHGNIINRGLIPCQIAAGVIAGDGNAKYTGLHALRHFYASWCINREIDGGLGLPAKLVQERLGHSSITVTLDTYGHLFPRGDDTASLARAEAALVEL